MRTASKASRSLSRATVPEARSGRPKSVPLASGTAARKPPAPSKSMALRTSIRPAKRASRNPGSSPRPVSCRLPASPSSKVDRAAARNLAAKAIHPEGLDIEVTSAAGETPAAVTLACASGQSPRRAPATSSAMKRSVQPRRRRRPASLRSNWPGSSPSGLCRFLQRASAMISGWSSSRRATPPTPTGDGRSTTCSKRSVARSPWSAPEPLTAGSARRHLSCASSAKGSPVPKTAAGLCVEPVQRSPQRTEVEHAVNQLAPQGNGARSRRARCLLSEWPPPG